MERFCIGVDPGKKTGVAIWDKKEKRIIGLTTTDFWGIIYTIKYQTEPITVVIENPNLNKPTFDRGANAKANTRISQNVGSNKREAELIIDYCKRNSVPCIEVRPNKAKWSQKEFEQVTGLKTRTNEHVRDAARLVIGY